MEFKKRNRIYRQRRSIQIILRIILLPVLLVMFYFSTKKGTNPITLTYIVYSGIGITAIVFAYSYLSWRCPECRKFLGDGLKHDRCKHCGVGLRTEKDEVKVEERENFRKRN